MNDQQATSEEPALNRQGNSGSACNDLLSDGQRCQCCNGLYATVYRVPNGVWSKIAPQPETLGMYEEHQFGGLLCIVCADRRAREAGIILYWDSTAGDWRDNLASNKLITQEII